MAESREVVEQALQKYQESHPGAEVDVRQPHPYSVRVRIIDQAFAEQSRAERERDVWRCLKDLDDSVFTNITMVLLLAPNELATSLANREFEDPLPSRL